MGLISTAIVVPVKRVGGKLVPVMPSYIRKVSNLVVLKYFGDKALVKLALDEDYKSLLNKLYFEPYVKIKEKYSKEKRFRITSTKKRECLYTIYEYIHGEKIKEYVIDEA